MHHKRPQPVQPEHRLVSLDQSDLEDLRRLLAKLDPSPFEVPGPFREPRAANDLAQRARDMLTMRRKRIAIFGPQMFAEPAWEMLLILYLSEGGQRQSQTNLCELSGASRSTGMRWIKSLVQEGLVTRKNHPTDKRRNFVGLSDKGRDLLELYLSEATEVLARSSFR